MTNSGLGFRFVIVSGASEILDWKHTTMREAIMS
jgi:hypothetical protein